MNTDYGCYEQSDQQLVMRRQLERERLANERAIARERIQWDAMLMAEQLAAEWRRNHRMGAPR